MSEAGALALAFAMERWTVHQAGASAARVHIRRRGSAEGSGSAVDMTLSDEEGRLIAEVKGLQGRAVDAEALGREQAKDVSKHLYRVEWPIGAAPASSSGTPGGRWVIIASPSDRMAEGLTAQLSAAGATCIQVEPARLGEVLPCDQAVCLWDPGSDDAMAEEALRVTSQGLEVVQRLLKESKPPRLWWVTAGAVATTPGDRVEPALAALWGLGRTVMQEHPELACTLVDLQSAPDALPALLSELATQDEERQVAWRGGERRVARLMRAPAMQQPPDAENYALESTQKGTLDRLALVPTSVRAPGPERCKWPCALRGSTSATCSMPWACIRARRALWEGNAQGW